AEQKIRVNSNAIHNYDSNFDQTIVGIENRITQAEQNIKVNSTAVHQYGSDLTQHVQANQNTTVSGNKTSEVKLWENKTIWGGKNTLVVGLDASEAVVKTTIAPLNLGLYGATVNTFVTKLDMGSNEHKLIGKDLTITGFETKIGFMKNDFIGVSKKVGGFAQKMVGTTQEVVGLIRKTKGVETEQAALKQETVAVKNSVGGLDNSAKGLTNKV
ncbi:MAG: hypothetical protein GX143_13235, partial [Alcaligenaceae bacterium]|nr:hypothetical protein [Alcaligenaceae bacterium]